MGVIPECQQRGDVTIGYEPDTPTAAAVAAIRTALGHMGLTSERHTARAAVATLDTDGAFVDEVRGRLGHELRA